MSKNKVVKDQPIWLLNHKLLAKTSSAAYTGIASLKKLGFNRVFKFRSKATGTKAYLAIQDDAKVAVVVFRGTETDDSRDIVTDINIEKAHWENYQVHSGFMIAYQSVNVKIENAIDRLPDGYKVYATGHSLGGALAILHGVYGEQVVEEVVTFGGPRVGGAEFARDLQGVNFARYVNNADIVPTVPRWNYRHGGDLHLITGVGLVTKNPGWMKRLACRLSYWSAIGDHNISEYIRKMP